MKKLLILGLLLGLLLGGCSALTPSDKTQTMGVYAFGIPGIAIITHTSQTADNQGDDLNEPTQENPVTVPVTTH